MNSTRTLVRRFAAAGLAVAAIATPMVATAPSASAYTVTSITSMPNRPVIYQVTPYKVNIGSAVTGPMWQQRLYQAGPIVYRTIPLGAGPQTVSVTYLVQKFQYGAFSTVSSMSPTYTTTIASTTNSFRAHALDVVASSGSYRVLVRIVWKNSVGTVVSSEALTMNQTGDYSCAYQTSGCSIASNSTYGGAWVTVS